MPYKVAKILVVSSSYWIVFFFYSFLFFLFLDLLNFADEKIDFLPEGLKYKDDNKAIITLLVLFIIVFLGVYGTFQANKIQVAEYTVTTEKDLKQDYTVVLVTDIHLGYKNDAEKINEIIQKVNDQNPDYILIGGDFFDGSWRPFYEEDINFLIRDFKSAKGIYMVLGNKDNIIENKDILKELFLASGVTILEDESSLLNEDLQLIGRKPAIEDWYGNGLQERMAFEDLTKNIDTQKFVLLMDHSPLDIYKAENIGVDLQVSGHTLAGQLYPFGVLTERFFPFDYGQLIRDNYNIIVSSGVGTWGPPVRIGTKTEIVKIKIKQIR